MKKHYGYLKPWEVAQYLGIRMEEVEKMIENKELPSRTIDGAIRVPWDKLEVWLDEEIEETELTQLSQHLENVDKKDVKAFVNAEKKDAR